MNSFEQMCRNLTSLIRNYETYETVSAEYSKILQVYPSSEIWLLSMLDSDFGNHNGYNTQRRMLEVGSTFDMAELGSPLTGEIYPYGENKELHYNQKRTNKP